MSKHGGRVTALRGEIQFRKSQAQYYLEMAQRADSELKELRERNAALEAEAKVLRTSYQIVCEERKAIREEVAALRARMVAVPERIDADAQKEDWYTEGWNQCLDELSRLNGKVVNEGLLRGLVQAIERIVHDERVPNEVSQEVAEALILAKRALLDEGKEVLDANPADA